jgi:hypothetical protein
LASPPTITLLYCTVKKHAAVAAAAVAVVLQGFGNVGAWAADILTDHGGKVTAVSDVNAAIVNENGLDIKGLRQHLAAGKCSVCAIILCNQQFIYLLVSICEFSLFLYFAFIHYFLLCF